MFCRLKLPIYLCFIINTKTKIMATISKNALGKINAWEKIKQENTLININVLTNFEKQQILNDSEKASFSFSGCVFTVFSDGNYRSEKIKSEIFLNI